MRRFIQPLVQCCERMESQKKLKDLKAASAASGSTSTSATATTSSLTCTVSQAPSTRGLQMIMSAPPIRRIPNSSRSLIDLLQLPRPQSSTIINCVTEIEYTNSPPIDLTQLQPFSGNVLSIRSPVSSSSPASSSSFPSSAPPATLDVCRDYSRIATLLDRQSLSSMLVHFHRLELYDRRWENDFTHCAMEIRKINTLFESAAGSSTGRFQSRSQELQQFLDEHTRSVTRLHR
jgi:hypothetical protein